MRAFLAAVEHRFVRDGAEIEFTSYLFLLEERGGTLRVADEGEAITGFRELSLAEVVALAEELDADPQIRAVLLTGAGKLFVGGADIGEMAGLDSARARAFITRVHGCCAVVRRCPVPVIARVNGHCYGAGMELAAPIGEWCRHHHPRHRCR